MTDHETSYNIYLNPLCTEYTLPHYILEESNFNFRYTRLWDLHILREKWLNYLQTVETVIRCCILQHLIWVCTVCQSPFYGSPDYNGLNIQTPLSFNHTLPNIEQVHSTIFRSKNCWRSGDRIWHSLQSYALQTRNVTPWFRPSDWRPGGRGFNPRRGRQHSFVEIDHEIFSAVILSLPLIQEGQLSVSGERMCTILVNRLED